MWLLLFMKQGASEVDKNAREVAESQHERSTRSCWETQSMQSSKRLDWRLYCRLTRYKVNQSVEVYIVPVQGVPAGLDIYIEPQYTGTHIRKFVDATKTYYLFSRISDYYDRRCNKRIY